MQALLDYLANEFPQYKEKVDKFHIEETRLWNSVFPSDIPERSLPFYQTIFNVIRHFLDEDVENNGEIPEQLFIQLPTAEIGRTDRQQWGNISIIHEIVAAALLCATFDKLKQNTECPNLDNIVKSKESKWFYTGSKLLNDYNHTSNLLGCWEIRENRVILCL